MELGKSVVFQESNGGEFHYNVLNESIQLSVTVLYPIATLLQ